MLETHTSRESCCFADDAQCDLTREFNIKENTPAIFLFKMILDSKFLPCRGNWSLLSNTPLMTCQYAEDYSYNIYIHDEVSSLSLINTNIKYKDLQLKRIYDSDKSFDEKLLFCHREYDGAWSDEDEIIHDFMDIPQKKSFFSAILSYLKVKIFE